MPYDPVHTVLVKTTWYFSRDTALSRQIYCKVLESVFFKPRVSCVIWDECFTLSALWGHTVTLLLKGHDHVRIELSRAGGLGCKHAHFLLFNGGSASCPVCVHIHLLWSDLRDWRSSVKHGGLQSGSGPMEKRSGNFYLAHFSVRTLNSWLKQQSYLCRLFVSTFITTVVCVSIFPFSSLLLAYKHDACHPVCFCASGLQ